MDSRSCTSGFYQPPAAQQAYAHHDIHAIKINLRENGPLLKKGGAPRFPLIGDGGEGSNPESAIWSCTTCSACMEVCPVFAA